MVRERFLATGELSLPVAKTEEEVVDLITNGMGWFIVVPEMWTGALERTPRVEVFPIEPSDPSSEEAYEVRAETIEDVLNYISSMVVSKPDGPYFIELKCIVSGYPIKEREFRENYEVKIYLEGDL